VKKDSVLKTVMAALFAAIILLTTLFLFHIHVGQGYVHLGDLFVYLSACFLPTPYAMLAAGVGAGLADFMSGHVVWVIPTVIIKSVSTLAFAKTGNLFCKRNVWAVLLGGVICVVGYYLAEVILYGNWVTPFVGVPMNVVQSVASGVGFLAVGYAMDRLRIRERIDRLH